MSADAFSALTEIDPRLAGTVLETLAEAGIAAWVRPFGGTRGGYLEVRVPARPLDCLYVDATRRGDALSVLAEQVPDLLGLRSGDAGQATAGGGAGADSRSADVRPAGVRPAGVRPADAEAGSQAGSRHASRDAGADVRAGQPPGAPGTAASGAAQPGVTGADQVGADPSGANPSGANPGGADPGGANTSRVAPGEADPGGADPGADRVGGGSDLDIEAAFALIVAGYAREAHNPFDLPPGSPREPSADGEAGNHGGPVTTGRPAAGGGPGERGGPAANGEGPYENRSAQVEGGPDGSPSRRPSSSAGAAPALPNTWFVSGGGQLSSGPPATDPRHDDSEVGDHDDHYDPPPAPPTPPPSGPTRWALVSIGLGLLLLIAPTLVALHASDLVHVAGVLMICTGVGILVARMRHEDEDDDPDDGAVV